MPFNLPKAIVIGAIILGMGAHWVVLQSVAWTGMLIRYSQQASLKEALEKTFDGKHPCRLCKVIKSGQHSQSLPDCGALSLKLEPFLKSTSAPLLYPRVLEEIQTIGCDRYCWRAEAPPTPPPILG